MAYYSGESVSWGVIDEHPDTYTIEQLGMVNSGRSSSWTSLINYNIPNGFSIGSYTYE